MVNTTQKISQSPVPDLEQFRAIAAQKDDRVISKRGEVKEHLRSIKATSLLLLAKAY